MNEEEHLPIPTRMVSHEKSHLVKGQRTWLEDRPASMHQGCLKSHSYQRHLLSRTKQTCVIHMPPSIKLCDGLLDLHSGRVLDDWPSALRALHSTK